MQRIDPRAMKEEEAIQLGRLLKQAFSEHCDYVLPGEACSDRLSYLQHRGKNRPYFEVIDNGSSVEENCLSAIEMQDDGGVFKIIGKVTLDGEGRAHFTPHKEPRLVKRQLRVNARAKEQNKAMHLAQHIPHLRSKHPEVDYQEKNKTKWCYVMREAKGITLKHYLETHPHISVSKRFQISIYVIRALMKQFHDYGITHRDVKSANIMIDPVTLEVCLIDVDFALHNEIAKDYAGSLNYMAPEALQNPRLVSTASDAYALGLFLRAHLWGGMSRENYSAKALQAGFRLGVDLPVAAPLLSKLATPDLEKNMVRNHLERIFASLNAFQPQNRTLLSRAVEEFEVAYRHYLTQQFRGYGSDFDRAREQGLRLKAALTHLAQPHVIHSREMLAALKVTLAEIKDEPFIIDYFVHVTNVVAFRGLRTKGAILETAQRILTATKAAMDDVQDAQVLLQQEHYLKQKRHPQLVDRVSERLNYVSQKCEELKRRFAKTMKTYDSSGNEIEKPVWVSSFDGLNQFLEVNALLIQAVKSGQAVMQAELQAYEHGYIKNNIHIFKQLKPLSQDPLLAPKNAVRQALINYLHERKTLSRRREEDLNALLAIHATSENEFKEKVERHLSTLQTGLFGRSKMRDQVRCEMDKILPARQD